MGRNATKYWCFTENNPERQIVWEDANVAYACWQKEICPTTGTPHYQGYVELKTPRRLNFLRSLLPRARWSERNKTQEAARNYCRKEDTRAPGDSGPWEFGVFVPVRPGQRNDLVAVKELLDQGSSMGEITQAHFETSARYYRYFMFYKLLHTKPRTEPPEVVVLLGKGGVGKSKEAFESCPVEEQYWKTRGNWWDGYEQQPTVIIDEFYGWMSVDFFFRLLDRYPLSVECKGGSLPFTSKRIFITSNQPPWEWWSVKYDKKALERRLNKIVHLMEAEDGTILRQEFTSLSAYKTVAQLMNYF